MSLEEALNNSRPALRSLSFHTDGRVYAQCGVNAVFKKRIYNSRRTGTWAEKTLSALEKLIKENPPELCSNPLTSPNKL